MKLECTWNEKMKFTANAGSHTVQMDSSAPIGSDSAMSPKQLMVAGICGCTAMDVVALLRKFKQPVETFQVLADATPTENGHPVIYREIKLNFKLQGPLDAEKVLEAVRLSQTQYCGVSAMISQAVPISYDVELNGKVIGSGNANFQLNRT